MTSLTYTKYELLRLTRNKRFFIFSLGFPLILFLTIIGAGVNLYESWGDHQRIYSASLILTLSCCTSCCCCCGDAGVSCG